MFEGLYYGGIMIITANGVITKNHDKMVICNTP